MNIKKNSLWLVLLLGVQSLWAQEKITIADIYSNGTFRQSSVYGIRWMNDGRYYSSREGKNIVKNDVTTGEQVEVIVDGDALDPQIEWVEYSFSADESQILFMTERESIYRRSYKAEFYVYDMASKKLTKLSEGGKQSYASLSPDGTKVAFVRDNDLFYTTLADMKEVQITNTGEWNSIINGSSDWVYEEEFYLTKSFEWSPDSKRIAFLTFDESHVKRYNMQLWPDGGQALYPKDYEFKYPKAGEKNAYVSLSLYDLASGKSTPIDLGEEKDQYIPRMQWTKADNILSVRRMNRLQNQLDVLHVNANDGSVKTILTEKNDTYVDLTAETLEYLEDGERFLRSSEKDGYHHLYLYDMEGKELSQITEGNWDVTSFIGIDESKKRPLVYYVSAEVSPLERHLYATELSSGKKTKLTEAEGVHRINMSRDFQYYLDYHSNIAQPLVVRLFETKKNKEVKVLEDNAQLKETVAKFDIAPKEMFTFTTSEGTELNGYMIKPTDFDAAKKYPVLMFQYSGPGSQQVTNSWAGGNFWWHQMLAQNGYIVSVVDGRGTGARGSAFKKMTYGQLGKYEVEDQIEAAKYLQKQSYVDADRIGIWGWSYGGYMSSLCMMQGADVFKLGIAVAPVTSWRFYDTIYTERYLGLPQQNASGYDDNSPLSHVNKLKGKFLLVHGTGDDNVHFQNAVALQDALIAANKQFDSFYYPNRAHGIYRGNARLHLYNMMTEFVLNNL